MKGKTDVNSNMDNYMDNSTDAGKKTKVKSCNMFFSFYSFIS
jgi:hypothetical protein